MKIKLYYIGILVLTILLSASFASGTEIVETENNDILTVIDTSKNSFNIDETFSHFETVTTNPELFLKKQIKEQ